jgi:hypothetical protein
LEIPDDKKELLNINGTVGNAHRHGRKDGLNRHAFLIAFVGGGHPCCPQKPRRKNMSNPSHVLASMNQSEILSLRADFVGLRLQYQLAISHLANGMRELTELLETKGVLTREDITGLVNLNVFINGGFDVVP